MAKGYVYVLKNPAHRENYFKIGMTTKTVEERIIELSRGSGVPRPYEEVCSVWFDDCKEAEGQMHELLKDYRDNSNREFFEIKLAVIINYLVILKTIKLEDKNKELETELVQKTRKLEEKERLSVISDLENGLLLFEEREALLVIIQDLKKKNKYIITLELLTRTITGDLYMKTLAKMEDLKNDGVLNEKVRKAKARILEIKQIQLTEQLKNLDFL